MQIVIPKKSMILQMISYSKHPILRDHKIFLQFLQCSSTTGSTGEDRQ